jgi:hypothetical protein
LPYARGGPSVVDNIELRCRAHNAFEAELDFGPRVPALVRETVAPYGRGEARDVVPILRTQLGSAGPSP